MRTDKRGHVRRNAAFPLELRHLQCTAQLKERVATKHGANKRRIWLERAADLRQRARDVVHPVQAQAAHGAIDAVLANGEALFVADDGKSGDGSGDVAITLEHFLCSA